MPDFDKLPPLLQWAFGIGAVLAGSLLTWVGSRRAKVEQTSISSAADDDAMLQTRLLGNNPREVTRADALMIYAAAL